ncbi:hypothetical protein [Duganella sp. Root198D2]|uniref:hypothetical protein n=1 Tax=Duganella sp. Root198D2 TaxID=1736489 RepID=UPI000B0C8179|nr:hypothetical protein [Duganella sp. Root198D2]
MSLRQEKSDFLRYELGVLTLKGALSTRSDEAPIYAIAARWNRTSFKSALRKELQALELVYSTGCVSDEFHYQYISSFSERVSTSYGEFLHGGRLRFGVTQKLVNLHLKYLWVAGLIEEPPHCPIDGIIRDVAGLDYDWTRSDSKSEYETAISVLLRHAHPSSLAVWELQKFTRRDQNKV